MLLASVRRCARGAQRVVVCGGGLVLPGWGRWVLLGVTVSAVSGAVCVGAEGWEVALVVFATTVIYLVLWLVCIISLAVRSDRLPQRTTPCIIQEE
jgi:hypothetical protein